nr:retrotransposon protein, putative, Ty1-copia subclass [Tanacetum cinerariifolium]
MEQLKRLGYVLPQDLSVGLILNGLNCDFVRFVKNYNIHNMRKTIDELHALLIEYKKGLPKKAATPQVMVIQGGRIQKANKKSLNAKGKSKGKGKGKDKSYILNPKNPKPFAKEHPTKDDTCHHYKEVWGYEALVKQDTHEKLQQRSVKCIFIGYPKETMGYYFYFSPENKIFVARGSRIYSWNQDLQSRSKRLIRLSESAYIDKILKRLRMETSKCGYISMQERLDLNKTQGASTPEEVKRMQNVPYASVVGSIMHAVRCTRHDVAFAQNLKSYFQHNSGEPHWSAVKTILKYLRNTEDMFLVYGRNPEAKLRVDCYCDAGFETDRDDIKSQTEYVFVLNGGAVDWKSSKQSTTAIFVALLSNKVLLEHQQTEGYSNYLYVNELKEHCDSLRFQVDISVTNHGPFDASTVVMLFSRVPAGFSNGAPLKQLVEFERVHTVSNSDTRIGIIVDPCEHLSIVNEFGKRILPTGDHILLLDDAEHIVSIVM